MENSEWIKVEDRSQSMPKHTNFKIKYEDGTEGFFFDKHPPLLITHWKPLSLREQQLKQAIGEVAGIEITIMAIEVALSAPSILRHCDPEIMKQAGWVSEEDLKKLVLGAAKYGFNYRDISQHSGFVPDGNILQWLQNELSKNNENENENS